MARVYARAVAAFLALAFAGIGASRAETQTKPPELPAFRVLANGAQTEANPLTLGHSLVVTVCVWNTALPAGKPGPDFASMGLMLGGALVAAKAVTVARVAGACAPDAAKPDDATGTRYELRFQVNYERDAKDRKWLNIFESRIGGKTALLGLADAAGKQITVEIDPAAATAYVQQLLCWEAIVFAVVALLLVGAFVAAIRWTSLLRDSGNHLAGKWYAYLGAKFEAWSAAAFSTTDGTHAALDEALRRLGHADPAGLMSALAPDPAAAPPKAAATKADFLKKVADLIDGVEPTYSLARFQMALWTIVIGLGFLLMYFVTATLFEIPANVLILMGVSGATYLGARVIDARPPAAPGAAQAADVPPQRSTNLFTDMVVDERGVALHRIQMLFWTALLIGVFVVEVVRRMVFTEFDATLLGLMGISNGSYLALKAMEK